MSGGGYGNQPFGGQQSFSPPQSYGQQNFGGYQPTQGYAPYGNDGQRGLGGIQMPQSTYYGVPPPPWAQRPTPQPPPGFGQPPQEQGSQTQQSGLFPPSQPVLPSGPSLPQQPAGQPGAPRFYQSFIPPSQFGGPAIRPTSGQGWEYLAQSARNSAVGDGYSGLRNNALYVGGQRMQPTIDNGGPQDMATLARLGYNPR